MKVQYQIIVIKNKRTDIGLRDENKRAICFGLGGYLAGTDAEILGESSWKDSKVSEIGEKSFEKFYSIYRDLEMDMPTKIEKLESFAKKMRNHLALQGIDLDF